MVSRATAFMLLQPDAMFCVYCHSKKKIVLKVRLHWTTTGNRTIIPGRQDPTAVSCLTKTRTFGVRAMTQN